MFGLTSIEFITMLPIVVLLFYLLPNKIRQYYLLVINIVFYASFGYKAIIIVLAEAVVGYVVAILLDGVRSGHRRKILFLASLTILISILVFFKIGTKAFSTIIAPLGISFYTLQVISYVFDIYKGLIKAEKSFIKILVYLSFFPTITSGPIYRYKDFSLSYRTCVSDLKLDYSRIVNGFVYMTYGYFLKLVVAERAAIPVNSVFSEYHYGEYGGAILFVIAVTYSIQIFADFAGYSAIVIGIAQIIGFDIPENFLAPYMSMSIKEFWGRWHISLSSWLRDYVYIPFGGNRKGKLRKYFNIIMTFIVSGFWHGLELHFFAWGVLHGVYQIAGDLSMPFRKKLNSILGIIEGSAFHKFIRRVGTFLLVTIAWLFFRTGVKDAVMIIVEMITAPHLGYIILGKLWNLGLKPFDWILLYTCMLIMCYVDNLVYKGMRIDKALHSQGSCARSIVVIIMVLAILILGLYGGQHDASYFVYRDF